MNKRLDMRLDKHDASRDGLVCLLCAAAAVGLSALIVPPYFPTNDDAIIQQVLAGTVSGRPTGYVSLINFCLAWPLSRLFVVAPGVPWWTLFHLAVIVLSMALAGSVVLEVMRRRSARGGEGRPTAVGREGRSAGSREERPTDAREALTTGTSSRATAVRAAVLLVAFTGVGCALVGRLQFTTTSSLALSTALLALVARGLLWEAVDSAARDSRRIRGVALPFSLFVVGFCIRRESGLIALAFWGLLVCVRLVAAWAATGKGSLASTVAPTGTAPASPASTSPVGSAPTLAGAARIAHAARATRPVWAPALAAALLCAGLVAANNVAYSTPEWSEYWRQSSAMAVFTDYPRSSYEEHADLYRSLGWSKDLYTLVRGWYQLDPRFDADTAMRAVAAGDVGVRQLLEHPRSTIKTRLAKLRQPVPLAFLLAFGAAVACGLVLLRGWRRAAALLSSLLACVLMAYLLARGRLLDRAMYAILMPHLALTAALLLDRRRHPAGEASGRMLDGGGEACDGEGCSLMSGSRLSMSGRRVAVLCVLALCVVMGAAAVRQYGRGSGAYGWFKWQDRNVEQFYDICEENPGTLYVFAGLGELDNMSPWRMEWPVNQTSWATWYYRAPWFAETLREAGFKGRPTVYDLLDSNVRLVTDSYTDLDLYTRYLKDTLGADVALQQEQVFGDDVTIWRVVRE